MPLSSAPPPCSSTIRRLWIFEVFGSTSQLRSILHAISAIFANARAQMLAPKLEWTPNRFWDSPIWNIDKSLPKPIWGSLFRNKTDFFQTWQKFLAGAEKKLDRQWLRIVHEQQIVKRFASIEFKQKWILPFCSLTYLVLDWYWTLIAQIDFRLSNRLVNINHLNLPCQIFLSVFCSRQEFLCQVWKISVLNGVPVLNAIPIWGRKPKVPNWNKPQTDSG